MQLSDGPGEIAEISELAEIAGPATSSTPSLLAAVRRRSPAALVREAGTVLNARWQLRAATHVGRWTRVTGRLHVSNVGGELVVGERVRLYSHFARTVLAVFPGGRLEIGDRCCLNY